MKKYFIIFILFILSAVTVSAQEDDQPDDKGGKLQQRMSEYIQRKLNLSQSEAERFRPMFNKYIAELRRTHRENKGDRPVLQLKIAQVRVKYRDEFKQIMDEKRANRVFEHQGEVEVQIRKEILERRQNKGRRTRINANKLL